MRKIILTLRRNPECISNHGLDATYEHVSDEHRYTILIDQGGWGRCKRYLLKYLLTEGLEGESLYMEHAELNKRVTYRCRGENKLGVEYKSMYLTHESTVCSRT